MRTPWRATASRQLAGTLDCRGDPILPVRLTDHLQDQALARQTHLYSGIPRPTVTRLCHPGIITRPKYPMGTRGPAPGAGTFNQISHQALRQGRCAWLRAVAGGFPPGNESLQAFKKRDYLHMMGMRKHIYGLCFENLVAVAE